MLTCSHVGFTDLVVVSAVEGLLNNELVKFHVFFMPFCKEDDTYNWINNSIPKSLMGNNLTVLA